MISLVLAMVTSVLGAIFNGYGSAHTHEKYILAGQLSWVLSNSLWVYLYIYQVEAVRALPTYYQTITFGTFLLCALYGAITILIKNKHIL